MSYILEALKKAQAERQLGNAPTIHAPQAAPAAEPGGQASRKPLFIGVGAGVAVAAIGALLLWNRAPAPSAPAAAGAPAVQAQANVPAAAVPAPAAPAPAVTARTPAASGGAASATLEVSAPPAPPVTSHAPRVAEMPAKPAPRPAQPAPAKPSAPQPALAATTAPVPPALAAAAAALPPAQPAPASRGAAPASAPEDSLPLLQQLPEAIQREVPRVAFGGYMYSANPADRLLLVDKALRHEGEEVAPGLVLEKLLPRSAVMNYRGTRYRVAY